MVTLLIVAVIGAGLLIFGEFALSREAKQSQEHRDLVLKLRQRIAHKLNRHRVLFLYNQEEVCRRMGRV